MKTSTPIRISWIPALLVAASSAAYAAPTPTPPAEPRQEHGALITGIGGLVAGTGVLGLALATDIEKPNGVGDALPYAATMLAVGTLAPPLVYFAGWWMRRRTGVPGALGLRILGWVAYGGYLTTAVILSVRTVQRIEPENGLISFTGGLGALSLALLSADTLIARSQALRKYRSRGQTAGSLPWPVLPMLAPIRSPEGGAGAVAGVVGQF